MSMSSEAILEIPPRFRVVSPAHVLPVDGISIVLRAGAAFGDGRHLTTQLCLQAIAALAPREKPDWRLLDFGSGSGILSIGAAKLGAIALGVEIDDSAIASAEDNVALSGVSDRVTFARTLDVPGSSYDIVVANILRGVLVHFAGELVGRLAPAGTLILSGLVSTDVPEVSACYAQRLDGRRPAIYEREEWRALVWR
jgi:ribosomal protein L11 methyltransferase